MASEKLAAGLSNATLVPAPALTHDDMDIRTPLVAAMDANASQETIVGEFKRQIFPKSSGNGERIGVEQYKLYKRRWIGIVALVLLNIVKGMNWVWFGAIAEPVQRDLGISLSQINMLGNIPHISYLAFSWCVPLLVRRWGLRWSSVFGCAVLLLSAWIRFAATSRGLGKDGVFGIMLVAQLLVGIVAPCFQVVGPRYAELWFDLNGRATATMIVAISDPLGTAVGQIVSPFFTNVRFGILVLALITTGAAPLSMLILPKPPLPPTYSGSLTSPPFVQTIRALLGRSRPAEQHLTNVERLDFVLLFLVFGILVAGTSSFSVFISQILTPYGYSNVTSGLVGGVFLIAGLVAAGVGAPVVDRVVRARMALAVKVLVPVLAVAWVGLVFAVKPANLAGILVVLIAISSISFILLPVGLELGVEITRSAEASTALLWTGGNLISFVWVVAMNALRSEREDDTWGPKGNMRRALVFNACFIAVAAGAVMFFTGEQRRRKVDEERASLGVKKTGKV